VPGTSQSKDTVLLYGHLDKQPEMVGWRAGLGPWTPVIRDGRLYGRGSVDDGYSGYAATAALEAVLTEVQAAVTKGEKVAIIGKNGVGKTTLVKMLAGELPPDQGAVKWGHQATVGYLPQDHAGLIRPGTTAFGWLRELEDKMSNEEISGLLGRMLFSGEERMKPTATLSGGETVRLLMSNLMRTKDNVLVLDEPTNHLDLQAIAALGEGLSRYEGTAFIVTHDQQLIGEVASRIWVLRDDEPILDFNGNFDEFLEKHPDLATHHR
jgi:ATPase subunit of ABC transporter with duplicated ATPase domains